VTYPFIESPRFPEAISYGGAGGPNWNSLVSPLPSGFEAVNQNCTVALHNYDVSHILHDTDPAKRNMLQAFMYVARGKVRRFRYQDPRDHTDSDLGGAGLIGTGVGDGTPGPMQLVKRYTLGGEYYDRPIKKPVAAPALGIYRAGTLKTLTTNYTLDTTTGLLTWVPDASSNASAISVGATTSVTLAANPGTLIAGQKLHLSGFTGADAALLNNLAHTINSISGAGPYVFTLATVTTGKTITVGAGAGKKYPQASEALTWRGFFDVPVRFDIDGLDATLESTNGFGHWTSIQLKEVRI